MLSYIYSAICHALEIVWSYIIDFNAQLAAHVADC